MRAGSRPDWAPVAQSRNDVGTREATYTHDPRIKFPGGGRWTVTSVLLADPHPVGDANLHIHAHACAPGGRTLSLIVLAGIHFLPPRV